MPAHDPGRAGPALASGGGALGLVALLVLHGAALWLLRTGFKGSDDGFYGLIAQSLLDGSYAWSPDVYHDRVLAWAPVAVVFGLVGASPETLPLWSMLCSVISLVLVWHLGRRLFGGPQALAGAFLFAVSTMQIHFASVHDAEPVYACLLLASVTVLWHAREARRPRAALGLGAGAALLFAGSFLAKLPAMWALPFFAVLAARDLPRRRPAPWVGFAAAGALAGAAYLAVYAVGVGDPLARIDALAAYNETPFAFHGDSRALLWRLLLGPLPVLATDPGYAVAFALAVAAGVSAALGREWGHPGRYVAGFGTALLLGFWLGSSSPLEYRPMPLNPKYLLALLPALCLWAGEGVVRLSAALRPGAEGHPVTTVLVAVWAGAGAFALLGDPRDALLLGAAAAVVLGAFAARSVLRAAPVLGVAGVLAVAVVPLAWRATWSGVGTAARAESRLMEALVREVGDGSSRVAVYTDPRSARMLPVYFGYEVPDSLRLVGWNRVGARRLPELARAHDEVWLYWHEGRARNMREYYGVPVPPVAARPPEAWTALARTEELGLYRVSGDDELPHLAALAPERR